MKKDNAVLILGGILLGFGQLARENYGFVYGAGSEGFGYNSITVLMYTWGFWAVYKMIKIFIESRSQKSEEKIDGLYYIDDRVNDNDL